MPTTHQERYDDNAHHLKTEQRVLALLDVDVQRLDDTLEDCPLVSSHHHLCDLFQWIL